MCTLQTEDLTRKQVPAERALWTTAEAEVKQDPMLTRPQIFTNHSKISGNLSSLDWKGYIKDIYCRKKEESYFNETTD